MSEDEEALFGQLSDVFKQVDEEGVVNYSTLTNVELADLINALDEELRELGAIIYPDSQVARDVHARRYAALIEQSHRK